MHKQTATAADPHAIGKNLYRLYREKRDFYHPHREYADLIARATAGTGMTPVRPLATMGTGGGPLLCDHCKKPIVLEGGKYNRVPVDVAWKQNPDRKDDWKSFISGGVLIEILNNGTLRVYHGYPGRDPNYCCNIAKRQRDDAEAQHDTSPIRRFCKAVTEFVESRIPHATTRQKQTLVNDVLNTLFQFDPGVGVNLPE